MNANKNKAHKRVMIAFENSEPQSVLPGLNQSFPGAKETSSIKNLKDFYFHPLVRKRHFHVPLLRSFVCICGKNN